MPDQAFRPLENAAMPDDELIARYVEFDPNHLGPGDVRLTDSAVPVWAIVGQLAVQGWRVEEVAADYGIPPVEVEAALAYYRRHGGAIDARLAANSASAVAPLLPVAR